MDNLGDVLKRSLIRVTSQPENTRTSSSVANPPPSELRAESARQPLVGEVMEPQVQRDKDGYPIIGPRRYATMPVRYRQDYTLPPAPTPEVQPEAQPQRGPRPLRDSFTEDDDFDINLGGSAQPAKDVCSRCKGVGWLRHKVPVTSPNFGRVFPCNCTASEQQARQRATMKDLANLDAFREKSLTNFDASIPGVREAYMVAREYATRQQGWLLLYGTIGSGKTHLAAAIANEAFQRGSAVVFAVVPDLLDQLRAAYAPDSESSFDSRFNLIRSAGLLVLDDLGTENATSWAREKLFQIINHRYNHRLPTVITSNVPPDSLEPRTRSRIFDVGLCRQIFMQADDFRQHRRSR